MKLSKHHLYEEFLQAVFDDNLNKVKSLSKTVTPTSLSLYLAISQDHKDIVSFLLNSIKPDAFAAKEVYYNNPKIIPNLPNLLSKKDFTIKTKHNSLDENIAAIKLRLLLHLYPLSPWLFTNKVNIDQDSIPHSHPLTLSTRYIQDDLLFLSTFIHEQLHHFYKDNPKTPRAIKKLKSIYDLPTFKGTQNDSYEHILIIASEFSALKNLLGLLKARNIIQFWAKDHYQELYQIVLDDYSNIRDIMDSVSLTPPGDLLDTKF